MTNFGDILYQDHRLLMIDKPTGLLSVPGIGPEKQDCLITRVRETLPEARIVHRLDRDTSGVMVLALDAEAHRQLSIQFQEREVHKTYRAIVSGVMERDQGEINLPIRKDLDDPPRQMVDHDQGREAFTNWRVLERGADRTRIELTPLTGRSHQLRLHLKAIGHPILGDDLYAPPETLGMADRLMLHAHTLTIVHPETAAPMTIEALCPF